MRRWWRTVGASAGATRSRGQEKASCIQTLLPFSRQRLRFTTTRLRARIGVGICQGWGARRGRSYRGHSALSLGLRSLLMTRGVRFPAVPCNTKGRERDETDREDSLGTQRARGAVTHRRDHPPCARGLAHEEPQSPELHPCSNLREHAERRRREPPTDSTALSLVMVTAAI